MRGLRGACPYPSARERIRSVFIDATRQPQKLLTLCSKFLAKDGSRADVLVLRAEANVALARPADALADMDRAHALDARMDGVPGLRGLILRMMALRASDAESKRDLLTRARDMLREADGQRHKYRGALVKSRLADVQRTLGG